MSFMLVTQCRARDGSGTFEDVKGLVNVWYGMRRDFPKRTRRQLGLYSQAIIKQARQYSSTTYYSLDELKAMGHPYRVGGIARRRNSKGRFIKQPFRVSGTVIQRPWIVNKQSKVVVGKNAGNSLHDSWTWKVVESAAVIGMQVLNTSEHSKYFRANTTPKRMILRPIMQQSIKDVTKKYGTFAAFIESGLYRNKR